MEGRKKFGIDAVCINQADNSEKGHQIDLMAEIFTTAERVLVWVGEAADDSDQLLSYVNELDAMPNSHRKTRPFLIHAKDRFFRRAYWNRTWVIQELFMAKKLVILCGDRRVEEEQFRRLLRELSAMGPNGRSR
jgi:hypothetical protein